MSILGRRVPVRAIVVLAALLILGTLIPVLSRGEEREIHLVVRNMAFYLAIDPNTPNPVITVRPGESVRITVRNEDQGIRHDFALPAARAATNLLTWNESADVLVTMPATAGDYEYVCRPHSAMMRGRIRVAAE